jgi:predicted short-subunit dehydrogenase-like oxidoreductase (DUF2520 family)
MRELERDFPIATAPERGRASARRSAMPTLAIIGAGRVGGSLATAAESAGLKVRLAGRDEAAEACRGAEAALLCVPDSGLRSAAETIAAAIPPLRYVGHVSGAARLDVLDVCTQRGASTFSLHPLQTIPDPATDLTGAPCAIAGGDAEAAELARDLAERLGMHPFEVSDEHRAAYHAAASIASNFLVTLEESAARLLGEAGVADARELLAPLVLRTAANWAERGAGALTGPIARGDEATVERHTEAIRELAPELLVLYEVLAARTATAAAEEDRSR